MKLISKILFFAIAAIFSSCSNDAKVEDVKPDLSQLPGTWTEAYPDDKYFSFDSYVTYTLDGNGGCEVYIDAMGDKANTSTYEYTYSVEGNVITLNPEDPDLAVESYKIIKLDSEKMFWLKTGFKESDAHLASELKKFLKSK